MKVKLIIFFLALAANTLMAQDFEPVTAAFKEGNASALAKQFDAVIDLSIDGKSSTVGRGDAESRLRAFFLKNEPRGFEIVHKGVSQSDVHYIIGTLVTSAGAYRLTAYFQKSMDDYLIQSLEIEKK